MAIAALLFCYVSERLSDAAALSELADLGFDLAWKLQRNPLSAGTSNAKAGLAFAQVADEVRRTISPGARLIFRSRAAGPRPRLSDARRRAGAAAAAIVAPDTLKH